MSTLVATDLDGTLWDFSDRCHPRTLAAVAELQRRGTHLLAATGRRRRGVEVGFELNQLKLPAVILNGSAAVDFRTGQGIFADRFDPKFISNLVARLADVGLSPAVLISPDRVVMDATPTLAPLYISAVADGVVRSDDLAKYVAGPDISAIGFVLMSMSAEQLGCAKSVFQDLEHDAYSYHLDNYYPGWMVMGQPPGVTKWTGIQRYIAETAAVVDRVVVLGDNANDLPMLEHADLAIGVEGGHPDVLEMAHLTVPSPSEGGWGDIVDLIA